MASHSHRASNSLRQSNKKHKTGITSKRSIKQKQGGKIGATTKHKKVSNSKFISGKRGGNESGSKKQRRIRFKQGLKEGIHKEVGYGGDSSNTPAVLTVIHLSSRSDIGLEEIVGGKLKSLSLSSKENVFYFANLQQGMTVYNSTASAMGNNNDLICILDQCRISNHILFVVSSTDSMSGDDSTRAGYISEEGERIVSGMKAQGLPLSNLHLMYVNAKSNPKKNKFVHRFMNAEFPSSNMRVYNGEIINDYKMLLRSISTGSNASTSKFVESVPRSYVVSEGGWEYNALDRRLQMRGFIRNAPLNPRHLLHVANLGTCTIRKVCDGTSQAVMFENDSPEDVGGVEFAHPDALDGEQNLVGFEEAADGDVQEDDATSEKKEASDYFSPWFDMIDTKQELEEHKSLTNTFNSPRDPETMVNDDDENNYNNRKQYQQEENRFPDEIGIQPNELAQDRLARYRSLKSFRKSYIDPKENLPEDYARIFHFQNFKGTKKDVIRTVVEEINAACNDTEGDSVMKDDADDATACTYIPVGTFVVITVRVSTQASQLLTDTSNNTTKPLISATTLLPHENKVSVLHMSLSPIPSATDYDQPPIIKSKDVLTVRCGWRTFQAKPVFSQLNLNCEKHKLERLMPSQGFCAMTVYGPVTYTPCPILIFQNDKLVASGSLHDIDADRIIIKRCVITGYPVRVRKRWATVKYMFYNPEDVKWFQPAGLTTKHGLQGNIMESIGEHGSMKCLFNQPIKQHDTVCLPLYKRIYPKFPPIQIRQNEGDANTDTMDATVATSKHKLDLAVW